MTATVAPGAETELRHDAYEALLGRCRALSYWGGEAIVREQWARLTIDQDGALKALPQLLPRDAGARRDLFEEIKAIRTAAGELDGEAKRRLDEMEVAFDIGACAPAPAGSPGRFANLARSLAQLHVKRRQRN